MKSIVLAAIAVVASPAMAADQFDLVCTAKQESTRFRVDLQRKEFCFDTCERVMPIAEITSGMLTFRKTDPSPPDNARSYNRVNRSTGEWEWYSYTPRVSRHVQDIKGACESAEFSGFPAAKF